MSKIKGVIFDWNGVIVDSLKFDHITFMEECKKSGRKIPNSMKFYTDLFHGNVFENLIKVGFTQPDIIKNGIYFQEAYIKNMKSLKLFPNIKKVLDALYGKYKIALITSNFDESVKRFLKMNKMEKYFDIVLTANTSRHKEDKINIFLKKFKLKPQETVFVGDTVMDIIASKNMNLVSLGATWGYHNKKMLLKYSPDFIVDEPSNILKIIERISNK